jgi:hypothetical protein
MASPEALLWTQKFEPEQPAASSTIPLRCRQVDHVARECILCRERLGIHDDPPDAPQEPPTAPEALTLSPEASPAPPIAPVTVLGSSVAVLGSSEPSTALPVLTPDSPAARIAAASTKLTDRMTAQERAERRLAGAELTLESAQRSVEAAKLDIQSCKEQVEKSRLALAELLLKPKEEESSNDRLHTG